MSTSSQVEGAIPSNLAFSAWADLYDSQQNPLLALERRYLLRLLTKIEGRDVLDVGCGTGRWLAELSHRGPHSLHGVDPSPEMLSVAATKKIPGAQLSLAACSDLPIDDASMDVLLASFVLSYEGDLRAAAGELARVARPGADLFLSDMHPVTAALLGWKRSFRSGGVEVELPAVQRSIPEILDALRIAGFVPRAVIQPAFGTAEEHIFAAHNKLERFAEAESLPAIYVLHLSKPDIAPARWHEPHEEQRPVVLHGGRCALGPREAVTASLCIDGGRIESISSLRQAIVPLSGARIDLTDYLLLPGLINAHDHLEFGLFPRLGRGRYENAREWAEDIHQRDAERIAVHRKIAKSTRLWWGGIRNLLSGATTVCHHNPIDPLLLTEDFPVRIVSGMGWEHSLSFAVDVRAAHGNTDVGHPFIIHCGEGIDAKSGLELLTLDDLGVLDQRTAIVHGLALNPEAAALLNVKGSSLIVCPSSNQFLFGRVHSREILESVDRLALGSDSPLTAIGDLLDEIRFAAQAYAMPAERLYSQVTDSPASILRLSDGEGFLRAAAPADLIAVRDRRREPAETLCSLSSKDIELVLVSGQVRLASASIFERLAPEDKEGLEPLSIDGEVRWLRAPVDALLREAEQVLGEGNVSMGGRSICRPSL